MVIVENWSLLAQSLAWNILSGLCIPCHLVIVHFDTVLCFNYSADYCSAQIVYETS